MQKVIVRFLLSLSSYSGVLFFYIVTKQDLPFVNANQVPVLHLGNFFIKNIAYVLLFAIFAYGSLILTKMSFKPEDTLEVAEEKPIESVAVPTYIGLFVIAIGLTGIASAVSYTILLILFLFWTRLEKIFYFNPIWLFFGYRFYEVKSESKNTYTLVTKRDRLKGTQSFERLRRLNNYTFLEY